MKKIYFIAVMLFSVCMISCNSCKKDTKETKDIVAEQVTTTDKEYMFSNYGADYRWFETQITMKDFLDEETNGTIESITNVFQVVEQVSPTSADVFVVLASHTKDSTAYDVKSGFWMEDQVLNNETIKVSFKEAFDKLMATNLPKPHSRHCVLRKEVAPVDANPQYIFGNTQATVYVDAVTGDVSDKNPAFPEEKGFKMPLGEWP